MVRCTTQPSTKAAQTPCAASPRPRVCHGRHHATWGCCGQGSKRISICRPAEEFRDNYARARVRVMGSYLRERLVRPSARRRAEAGDRKAMARFSMLDSDQAGAAGPGLRPAKGPQLAGFDVGGSVSAETFPARSRFWAICLCAGGSRFPAGPSSAARGSH